MASAAHVYYADSIYLAPAVVAILLVVHDVEGYRRMRSAFVATTLLAYAAFFLYPAAPPCLLPQAGSCPPGAPAHRDGLVPALRGFAGAAVRSG